MAQDICYSYSRRLIHLNVMFWTKHLFYRYSNLFCTMTSSLRLDILCLSQCINHPTVKKSWRFSNRKENVEILSWIIYKQCVRLKYITQYITNNIYIYIYIYIYTAILFLKLCLPRGKFSTFFFIKTFCGFLDVYIANVGYTQREDPLHKLLLSFVI